MSRFFHSKYTGLVPYTPGEQPREQVFVKLNTNESPFPPSPKAVQAAAEEAGRLQLYSDPTCKVLHERMAALLGIGEEQVIFTNGSDEGLLFAFMAFCEKGAVFADITYGFYSVFAELTGTPYRTVPLKEDFTLDIGEYLEGEETVFIANPNAPTGLALPLSDIEKLLQSNPERIVVVDEAYVDFGGESAVKLIDQYDNLLVVQTFSKSRSLAGGRLGMVFGNAALIADLETLRYSTNPYNVNRMTMAAGAAVLEDEEYTQGNLATVVKNRAWTAERMREMGFVLTDSRANFLFARHPEIAGGRIYQRLRDKGVLVRHFDTERLKDYNRITVGSAEQMETLVRALKEILDEEK